MQKLKNEWEKACLLKPTDNILSHIMLKNPRIFQPSYEVQNSPINMNLLLSMEYARIWTQEKNDFLKDRAKKAKPKFIKNDYWKWIEKRQPKVYKSCPAQGLKNLLIKGKS
ncbi:uncharacterized protein LOC133325952 [Musca vetustissima]|uniref:uncharacterized protein LOC133325952 n=1 Tax=Musca vetustissima TaxID=27455 RepID=UPI002AB75566|nr:uncharacterized protein LOC133325952 [Musca vetustissima]